MQNEKKTKAKGKSVVEAIDHIDEELDSIWASLEMMSLAGQQSNRSIETSVALLAEDLGRRVVAVKNFIHETLNV